MVHETFTVWRVRDMKWHNADPEMIGRGMDFDGAVEMGALHTVHKGQFFVRRENEQTGAVTLHFYAIKQKSAALLRRSTCGAHFVKVRPEYAEHMFDLRVPSQVPA
jgi:hypothetical protein